MAVKYGIIGCGSIGQKRHLPECAANPNSKVVAVVDPNKERVDEIAKKYGAKAYTDYKQMLKSADLDAVVVGTPNVLHAPMTLDALKAGLHVLCEKPMATTREDARAMIKAAEKAGKYLMIGLNQRLAPVHVCAKEILKSGRLGKPLAFRTSFKHGGPEFWSIEGPSTWFFRKKDAGLGVTADLGVHKADLMRWLLDDEFCEVNGMLATLGKRYPDGKLIDLDDNAFLNLKTRGGILGSLIVSWTCYGRGLEENYTYIYCEKGVMAMAADPEYSIIVSYNNGNKELHKVGAMSTNVKQTSSGVIDSLTKAILEGTPPAIDGVEGYAALDVILTGMDAARLGKTLKIECAPPCKP